MITGLLVLLIISLSWFSMERVALGQHGTGGETTGEAWDEARRLYLAEDFAAAREKIDEVISAKPDRYDTWQAWVATYRPGPRLDEAERELQRRSEQNSENARWWFARALVGRYSGNWEHARECFRTAARLDPMSEVIPLEHHHCYPEGDPRAKQLLEQAFQLNPSSLPVLEKWIQLQLQEEQRPPEVVEKELKLRFARDDQPVLADFALGVCYCYREPNSESHKQRAVELLERVADARPSEAIVWSQLERLYRQRKQYDKCADAIEQGRLSAWWQATWLHRLEYLAYSCGDKKSALEQSQLFTKFFPDSKRAWNLLALDLLAFARENQGVDAVRTEVIEAFRKAIERDWWREDSNPRWNLAYFLSQAGRASEALPVYLDLLDIDPDYLDERDVPAAIIGDLSELTAEDLTSLDLWMGRKIEELPNEIWLRLMRARITAGRGQYDAAARQFADMAKSFPDSVAEVTTHWGHMLVKQKKFLSATERFLLALRSDVKHDAAFKALDDLLREGQLSDGASDDLIQQFHQLAKARSTEREPLEYLGAALETRAFRAADHHLYEEALVPRLKLLAFPDAQGSENGDQDHENVADLYAVLGDFDSAYLFYEKAGKDSYRAARELLEMAATSSSRSPLRQTHTREVDSPPQVFSASNTLELDDDNKVNLKNANYLLGLTDTSSRRPSLLDVKRYYNSRSSHRGLFGHGWTTFLETRVRLEEAAKTFQVLTESGYGVEYELPFDYPTRIAEELFRNRKREGKQNGGDLRKRLLGNISLLMNEAEKAGVLGAKQDGMRPVLQWTWLVKAGEVYGNEHGKLHRDAEQLVFEDAESQSRFRWNREFQLTEVSHPALGRVVLEYSDGRVVRVRDVEPDSGHWIRLEYNAIGNVNHLVESNGGDARYIYTPDGDCLASRSAEGEVHGFLYDSLHNLTAIRFANGRTQTMRYNMRSDWILAVQSPDRNLCYEFDFFDLNPEYEFMLYGSEVRSYWLGKPMSRSALTYKRTALRNKESGDSQERSAGFQRQYNNDIYMLSKDPVTGSFSNIVKDGQRSILEWDESGQLRILKADGSVIRFSFADIDNLVVDSIQTPAGNYQFRFDDEKVASVTGPRGFRARIVRSGRLPVRIDSDEWSIELVRDSADHVIDYRLRRNGKWKNIGRDALKQFRRVLTVEGNAWKLGQSINEAKEDENADVTFVMERFGQLYDALSRSKLPGHSLDCVSCFPGAFHDELRGYEWASFEKLYLPKYP